MPCKKIPERPLICTPSTRRLLETVPIKDLPQSCFCHPYSNQDSGAGPSECGPCACDEDDCAPGACCGMNRQCDTRTSPEQNQVTETCLPSCKSLEVETMIDEMRKSQEIIRQLALEAMEILHAEQECPMCKQEVLAQKVPNAKDPYCKHCKNPNLSEPTEQSRTKLLATPLTPLQAGTRSRTSSVPIAQTAFQIKEGRLPKTEQRERDNITEDSLKKMKSKVEIAHEESLKEKEKQKEKVETPQPNVATYYKPYEDESKSCLKKIFGSKSSTCSCDGKWNLDVNCACKGKVDCRCGSKSYFQRLFGKKPSVCSCSEDPMAQYAENEGRFSSTCVKKMFKKKNDCYCPPKTDNGDKDKKENGEIGTRKSSVDVGKVELRRSSLPASLGVPKCDTCPCRYPPSYNQYFTCTGQVTGNCSCDKNV